MALKVDTIQNPSSTVINLTLDTSGNVTVGNNLTVTGTTTVAATTIGNLTYTGTLTGSTGILNIGSGQLYKDASGNVGIGTNSPKTRLQSRAATTLNAPSLGSATSAPFYVTNNDPDYGLLVGTTTSDGHVWLQAQRTDGTATAYNITLNEAGGNVGIGLTAPAYNLHVRNAGGNAYVASQYGTGTIGYMVAASNEVQFKAFNGTNDVMTFATGASERMRIDASGRVTMPYQPCFWAYAGAGNPTLTSTATALVFTIATTNVGSYYSTANGRFTAPVAGTYLFNWTIAQTGATGGPVAYLGKNGTAIAPAAIAYGTSYNNASMNAVITLAANDYVQVLGQALNGTSPVIDMGWSSFSGHLIG